MTAEWFKRNTDVLADQLFTLQLARTHAAERGISVTELLDQDRSCDELFLGIDELQTLRSEFVAKFHECPSKFRWNALYCLCAIEVLISEVFVDDSHVSKQSVMNAARTRAASARDLDSFVGQKLLFEFFWHTDHELLTALKAVISSTGILCTQRSLPSGTAFAPVPCVQCRFDHAFEPETEIVQIRCTHLTNSLAPMSPDAQVVLPELPTETPNNEERASNSPWFPNTDSAFEQLASTDGLVEVMASLRSSTTATTSTAKSTMEASNQLMSSKVLRDYREERMELVEIRSTIEEVANQRRESTACKTLNEWMLLRSVEIIEALARRLWRTNRSHEASTLDHGSYSFARYRLRQNLRGMVLQETELRQLSDTFNDLILDPLTRSRQRIFRPYIDSRKFFYAIGIAPANILTYDRLLAEVTNKTVFELRPRHPYDRFFKAVYICGLFRLYLTSIGCNPEFVPALSRADDSYQGDGFCFAVDGWNIVAVMKGRYVARTTDETILSLCIEWIRLMLEEHIAGEATDSLRHLLESTTI